MVEDVLKEVRTAVETNLPALLDAEDTAYAAADVTEFGAGHAIVLEDIVTIRFEEYAELQLQEYPALFLLPRGTEDRPMLHNQTNLAHTVDVIVLVVDTDPRKVARRLFRTVEALRRMLTTNVEGTGTASDPTFQVDIVNVAYGPNAQTEWGGGLEKGATMTITLVELEDRP